MDKMEIKKMLSVFKGRRILVTGDTGFKGSWLSLWLHELGADVVGYALPPKRATDHFNLIYLEKVIHHINGDIRDLPSLSKVVKKFRPEFLFHLAAQSLVRLSYDEPKLTFDTNISGSVNVLETVRLSTSLKVLVYITSDKCYQNKECVWGYRENDELGGYDPYSASKAAAEIVFSAYMNSFFSKNKQLGTASTRAGNVIGGGDWAENRILPDCIKALLKGKPIVLRNPAATRPWQHVMEPLMGYLMLAARLYAKPKNFSGAWNFGPEFQSIRTVKDLAETVVKCWGSGTINIIRQRNAPHEATLLRLNCDKSHQLLGWQPHWDFTACVNETVRWYKEVSEKTPPIDITRQQINAFMEA